MLQFPSLTVDLMAGGILGEARVRGYQNNC